MIADRDPRRKSLYRNLKRQLDLRPDHPVVSWACAVLSHDVFRALPALGYLRRVLADYEWVVVHRARSQGVGWYLIGSYLGISRQGAFKRFRVVDDPAWEPPKPLAYLGPAPDA